MSMFKLWASSLYGCWFAHVFVEWISSDFHDKTWVTAAASKMIWEITEVLLCCLLNSLDKLVRLRARTSSPSAATPAAPSGEALNFQQAQCWWCCGGQRLRAKSRTLWWCWAAPSWACLQQCEHGYDADFVLLLWLQGQEEAILWVPPPGEIHAVQTELVLSC